MKNKIYSKILKYWHKSEIAKILKKKRFNYLFNVLLKQDLEMMPTTINLLDLGCGNGKDFLRFLFENNRFNLYGIDLHDHKISATNFTFLQADAEKTDFPDKFFDMTISIGVLEHIHPIEKLCKVISEIDRISKSYYVVIPSIATLFEPHTGSFLWQLKDHNKKKKKQSLNYLSDDAWLKFEGFKHARTTRKYYLPFIKQDLWIYKNITQQ